MLSSLPKGRCLMKRIKQRKLAKKEADIFLKQKLLKGDVGRSCLTAGEANRLSLLSRLSPGLRTRVYARLRM
ncbi:MAG: hypothetical protein RJA61_296 [Candidatus Parcubacteria bacterium]|jgi:hypothetical protein